MGRIIELKEIIGINEFYPWLITNIIFAMIFSLMDDILFIQLFKVKAKKKNMISSILIGGVFRTLFLLFIPVPYYRILNIILTIGLFKIFYKQNIEKCILGEVINGIIVISIEAIFSKLFCFVDPNVETYEHGAYNFRYTLYLKTVVTISRLIIYYIVKKKKIELNISDNLSKKNRNTIIVVCIICCFIVFFNAIEMTMYISDFPYSIFVIDIISLIVYFYITMKGVFRITKLEEQDIKIQNLEAYNKTLSIMYDSIRGFRHDFSNFVQALNGYVQTDNIEGIKSMSASIVQDCININNMEILDPKIINNPAVYSIITNKYYLAQKNKISMTVEVMVDLNEIKISTYDFCRILGILLDNAIEAANECDKKIINVRFMQDRTSKRKLIIVENTYKNKNVDIDKIFEKGYSTKKEIKDEHGLGLWTVRKILKYHDNLNLYTTKNELFKQQLEVYDN